MTRQLYADPRAHLGLVDRLEHGCLVLGREAVAQDALDEDADHEEVHEAREALGEGRGEPLPQGLLLVEHLRLQGLGRALVLPLHGGLVLADLQALGASLNLEILRDALEDRDLGPGATGGR